MPNPDDRPTPAVGPLQQGPAAATSGRPRKKSVAEDITEESTSYVNAIFEEFANTANYYHSVNSELLALSARVELAEKMVCVTREHLKMSIRDSEKCALPDDWKKKLASVEFVGVRLVEACSALLKRHGKLTTDELVRHLNKGMFRFRTNTPLREIHAALLRQQTAGAIERDGDTWTWVSGDQMSMRFRMATAASAKPESEEEATAKLN